jgi:hypothetical protein
MTMRGEGEAPAEPSALAGPGEASPSRMMPKNYERKTGPESAVV